MFCLILMYFEGTGQNLGITGRIADDNNHPVEGALVQVLNWPDSAYVNGGRTNDSGIFRISGLFPGSFLIRIQMLGYKPVVYQRELVKDYLDLGTFLLSASSRSIREVTVEAELKTGKQKGDTSEFNAGAFKTNPDATAEDLVNKLPGVTGEDGKLKAQGEDIKQVLVDGKPFFGEDPASVLKNIPAEVIDKIQIFDRKSDQSQLTGFDDGNTSKTINIVTRVQFRDGIFGKVQGGYGYHNKWKAGGNINMFKDKRRFTVLLNTNNINEQNFTSEDLLGVAGSNTSRQPGQGGQRRNRSNQGGNDVGNFLVDNKNGIILTRALGVNFTNSYKQTEIAASYFVNFTDNHALSFLNRRFISAENNGLGYQEFSETNQKNTNHRLNLKLEHKIKERHQFIFQPGLSLQINDGKSVTEGNNNENNTVTGFINNRFGAGLSGLKLSVPISYKYKINERGSVFSAIATPGLNGQKGDNNLSYSTTAVRDTLRVDTLDQDARLDLLTGSFQLNLSFTQSINKKSQMLISWDTRWLESKSVKETFHVSGDLRTMDTLLSNSFMSKYLANAAGIGYKFQDKKLSFNAGLSFQSARLVNQFEFPYYERMQKPFLSILPNLSFHYRYTQSAHLRISYNSRNNAPTATQLQSVINNQNPLFLTVGNPELKQDWQNNLNLRYTSMNTAKNTAFFVLLGGTIYRNAIVNGTYITPFDTLLQDNVLLARGAQISSPVNMNGAYNLRFFTNYSFPVKRIKSKLNLNLGANQNRTPTRINYQNNLSVNSTVSAGVSLVSNISKKVDFNLTTTASPGWIRNSLQPDFNSNYLNQNTQFKIQVNPWKGLILQTEGNHQYFTGMTAGLNQSFLLWNAAVGYKFLKDRQAELRLLVFDILKENNSLVRNSYETYYEDIETNVLQRYWMLSFTYNFKKYRGVKSPEKEVPGP